MSDNLNILDILKMFAKWWWVIAIVAIVGAGGTYTYSEYFANEIYVSKGSFYISSAARELDTITLSTLNANTRFSETYIELAQSDSVLEQVRQKLLEEGYNISSTAALRSTLSFSVKNETEVLEVSASNRDPYRAQAITNAVLSVAPQEIKRIVKAGEASVVDTAKLPSSPSYPNVMMNTITGFFAGIVLGCILVFLFEFFDLRIKPDNNLEQMYGIPVIGNIPEIRK